MSPYALSVINLSVMTNLRQLFVTCLLIACWPVFAYRLTSGEAVLNVEKQAGKTYGLSFAGYGRNYHSLNGKAPITLEVNGETLTGFYTRVRQQDSLLVCFSVIRSACGSVFEVTDTFRAVVPSHFRLNRHVSVSKAAVGDLYFNSYFGLTDQRKSDIHDFEFFVPGVWYRNNEYLYPGSLASDYSDNYFYFREDRLPLPVVAARDKKSGLTIDLMHLQAHPESFFGENGLHRIVDGRMQFGSLGFTQFDHNSILFVFPGIEGEKTYTGWLNGKDKRFSYRSHPVKKDIKHTYTLQFGLSGSDTYPQCVEKVWKSAWDSYAPEVCDMDVKAAYNASIEVLDAYLENVNGAPGWPFAVYLPDGVARAYNYQMGFIGFQLSNAYFLLRNGLEKSNPDYVHRACEVVDFWTKNSVATDGLPKTWTDAYIDRPATWRNYDTYMRVTAGGMEGIMSAWSIMKKYGQDRPGWLSYCRGYGDWLARNQQPDGSFFNCYDWKTGAPTHKSKYTTTNVIRFLIELYKATGDETYRNTALKAGNFSYDFIHNDYLYVGGVIDNPNVKDRESGQLAIYAFLGLFDTTGDDKWKDAAVQAARYSETFMFSYAVPMLEGDTLTDFPKHRNIIGQTLIATGHSGIDNGMAFSSFQYYRLYLLTGDRHFLHVARLIQRNTLQIMDLDGRMGYKYRGLLTECFSPQSNRGHSVRQQLPWDQAAIMEPMHRFMDAFGEWDIDVIERWPMEKRLAMIGEYAKTQGMYIEKVK